MGLFVRLLRCAVQRKKKKGLIARRQLCFPGSRECDLVSLVRENEVTEQLTNDTRCLTLYLHTHKLPQWACSCECIGCLRLGGL